MQDVPSVRLLLALPLLLGVWLLAGVATPASAGGQGPGVPSPARTLRSRDLEVRVVSAARFEPVAAPGTPCNPYFAGGVPSFYQYFGASWQLGDAIFRCAETGAPARPVFVPGAELVATLDITNNNRYFDASGVEVTREDSVYAVEVDFELALNVEPPPGVTVQGPVLYRHYTGLAGPCSNGPYLCWGGAPMIEPFGPAAEPICNFELEYVTDISRAALLEIGRQAFPSLLCRPNGQDQCTFHPAVVFVDGDGSLQRGCGDAVVYPVSPDTTPGVIRIRFAEPATPRPFESTPAPGSSDALPRTVRAVGDVDGDGFGDLVSSYTASGVSSWEIQDFDGAAFTPVVPALPPPTPGSGPAVLAPGELDLVAPGSGGLTLYEDFAGAAGGTPSSTFVGSASGTPLLVRDVIVDGVPEIAAGTTLYEGLPGGGYDPVTLGFTVQAIEDIDGDACLDLIGVSFAAETSTYLIQASLCYAGSSNVVTLSSLARSAVASIRPGAAGTSDSVNPGSIAVGDLDGDGDADLAVRFGITEWSNNRLVSSSWLAWLENEAAAPASAPVFGSAWRSLGPGGGGSVSIADLDRDQRPDVLAGLVWYRSLGGGAFQAPSALAIAGGATVGIDDLGAVTTSEAFVRNLDHPLSVQLADPEVVTDAHVFRRWGCRDGVDNDGDGGVDYPADPGCTSSADPSERNPAKQCDDGLDNDGDGKVDYQKLAGTGDPGCVAEDSNLEKPQCQDGRNNDNQAGIDFDGGASLDLDHNDFIDAQFNSAMPAVGTPDPQCVGKAWSNKERGGCGLGFEIALALPLLAALRRRRGAGRVGERERR
jgi:hypothetical protein